ncbi:MAG: Uma2 family endonuclease [Gemmataceae bacterium]
MANDTTAGANAENEVVPARIGLNRPMLSNILLAWLPTLAFLGIVVWSYGDARQFFHHPARVGWVVASVLLAIIALFTDSSGLGSGRTEDRHNRWIFAPLLLLSIVLTWLPPYLDGRDLWTLDQPTPNLAIGSLVVLSEDINEDVNRERIKSEWDRRWVQRMSTIVIADQVRIPSWVNDLESFRRWSRSDDYPERGWVSFLDGEIWVDMNMEQLFFHNRVKTQFTVVLGGLIKGEEFGYHFSDRAALSNEDANLYTEPDGTFCSFAAIEGKRVSLVEGVEGGHVEMEGTPDMVLEVVSTYSVRKDSKILGDLYWRAGIAEYWLVDARKTPLRFDILHWSERGYISTRRRQGWLKSKVFGQSFLLETKPDRLGHPQFFLRLSSGDPSSKV